jgi:hypothetical protein
MQIYNDVNSSIKKLNSRLGVVGQQYSMSVTWIRPWLQSQHQNIEKKGLRPGENIK